MLEQNIFFQSIFIFFVISTKTSYYSISSVFTSAFEKILGITNLKICFSASLLAHLRQQLCRCSLCRQTDPGSVCHLYIMTHICDPLSLNLLTGFRVFLFKMYLFLHGIQIHLKTITKMFCIYSQLMMYITLM